MTNKIKKIALLCSGGDSPGMNAAVRAVVRTALYHKLEIVGVQKGYAGLLQNQFRPLDPSSVGNIIQRGGTVLQTSRCPEFHEKENRKKAFELLTKNKVEALVVIGGDGSFNGAYLLHQEHQIPVIGIPGTIDNDISGTDYTIGFFTAVQTAVEAVDKIRDTASSHERIFLVEVMGRNSAAIANHVGLCTGAETVILSDKNIPYQKMVSDIKRGIERGKSSSIIVVAEGQKPGLSYHIQTQLEEKFSLEAHVCILGHTQRGGSPNALDRYQASRMGYEAVQAIISGESSVVTAVIQGKVTLTPLEKCLQKEQRLDPELDSMIKALSI